MHIGECSYGLCHCAFFRVHLDTLKINRIFKPTTNKLKHTHSIIIVWVQRVHNVIRGFIDVRGQFPTDVGLIIDHLFYEYFRPNLSRKTICKHGNQFENLDLHALFLRFTTITIKFNRMLLLQNHSDQFWRMRIIKNELPL